MQPKGVLSALLLAGVLVPGSTLAGGAFHTCAYDCRVQRPDCIDAVRAVSREARAACTGDPAPRRCRQETRTRARVLRRACAIGKVECVQCCHDCLDAALADRGGECPGFGTVGPRVCWLSVCGDRRVTGTEVCDDGNPVDGDGCDHDCTASP